MSRIRSQAFPVRGELTTEKLRGGYYTPRPIASFLARWVADAGERILEPSCGDGAILQLLRGEVTGVEIDGVEAAKARAAAPDAKIVADDLFRWFGSEQVGRWDGVAGNPPFIRFQNWTEPTRELALALMRSQQLRPTKLTNAWVPFVVASVMALRTGGRLALVAPAELLQVTYAADVRGFLVDQLSEITVVTFKRLLFEGVLQEVVLVLGVRGEGPAQIRVIEVEDSDDLPPPEALAALPHAPALQHDREKWIKYFLEPAEIEVLRAIRDDPAFCLLGDLADVDVGVVTGRNQFFVLRPSDLETRDLARHVIPLVSRSAQLRGITFDQDDFAALEEGDARCKLLAVQDDVDLQADSDLNAYVLAGEAEGVHDGYKCSIRKRWWVVPSVWAPDAFLLRQIYDHPRIVANRTRATSTDTVHRVRLLNGDQPDRIGAASVNSASFAFAEVLGRSYGGGVLELEPREAEALPLPRPRYFTKQHIRDIDRLIRSGDLENALSYVDGKVLVGRGGVDESMLFTLRIAWRKLRDRRMLRGRSTSGAGTLRTEVDRLPQSA